MRRWILPGTLLIWLTLGGSSCQTTFNGGGGSVSASGAAAGVTIAALGVVGGLYCLSDIEWCFPDEEALRQRAAKRAEAQAAFVVGLRRFRTGDPNGLRWICRSAYQGFADAQYLYGSYLAAHDASRREEARAWLRQAAAQGHAEAQIVLRQKFGEAGAIAAADQPPATSPSCEGGSDLVLLDPSPDTGG